MKRPVQFLCAVLIQMCTIFQTVSMAAGEIEITRIDGHYLDRLATMLIEWQSENPVVKASVTIGRETREILVDPYDNRRNPRGYHGSLSFQLPADPQQSIPYVVQLEDDLRQLSPLTSGKISSATTNLNPYSQPYAQSDDSWGRGRTRNSGSSIYQQPANRSGAMLDKLIEVVDRFDLAPSIDKVKANILSPDNVSFSSRANDDKMLNEVRFRIYDRTGTLVAFESVTGLGKVWQGTTQTFTLGGGLFRVTAQAIDSAGNTSKEESASFELTGKVIELKQLQDTVQPQTVQPELPLIQPTEAAPTSTLPNLDQPPQQQYDSTGQPIYSQPAPDMNQPPGTAPSSGTPGWW